LRKLPIVLQVLSGFLATVALTAAKGASAAATPVDLFDDRKAKQSGFDIIYEARDLDLPQSVRDGFTQARASVDATLKRVKESEKRIDTELEPLVQKAYW
jgi:photosystem II oxygen-evolving enhancer protein 3